MKAMDMEREANSANRQVVCIYISCSVCKPYIQILIVKKYFCLKKKRKRTHLSRPSKRARLEHPLGELQQYAPVLGTFCVLTLP